MQYKTTTGISNFETFSNYKKTDGHQLKKLNVTKKFSRTYGNETPHVLSPAFLTTEVTEGRVSVP